MNELPTKRVYIYIYIRYTILINNCYIYTIGNSQYQTSLRALTELMYGENGF